MGQAVHGIDYDVHRVGIVESESLVRHDSHPGISSAKYSANCCMVLFERTIIAMSELSAPALSNSLTASAGFAKSVQDNPLEEVIQHLHIPCLF